MTEYKELAARHGLSAVEIDMISHGDMIGPELGGKILARIEALEAERDEARRQVNSQSDYSIQLQRLIEAVCRGNELRADSADLFHHKMIVSELPNYRNHAAAEARCKRLEEALSDEPPEELDDDEALSDALHAELRQQQAFSIERHGTIALGTAPFLRILWQHALPVLLARLALQENTNGG